MNQAVKKDNTRIVLAFMFIAIGALWLLRKLGFYLEFPKILWENIFYPFRQFFIGWGNFVFSWQMVLIIVGLILLAGKRSLGVVFIVVGGIFILPKLFYFPGLSLSLLLPVFLIGLGVAMVVRRI